MAHKPLDKGQIADRMPEPDPDEQARQSLQKIKHKFIVMSGKGGVGKTSVSVNLALALAGKGFKVGLMDVDLHGPDIPHMLGLSGMLQTDDTRKMAPIAYSDHLKVISMESLMHNRDEAIIWRGPVKHSAIRQFIGDVNWGELDFLIIDSPPGTGDEPLTVAQLIPDAKAVIVTTPQEVALADIRKSISFCRNVRMEFFGIIENMSGFTCPHCHQVVDLFETGGGGMGGGRGLAKGGGRDIAGGGRGTGGGGQGMAACLIHHMEISPRAISAAPTPTHCRRLNFSLRTSQASRTVAAG
ncbi:MAG: P-loop NTPase [Desulfotignum sp.]